MKTLIKSLSSASARTTAVVILVIGLVSCNGCSRKAVQYKVTDDDSIIEIVEDVDDFANQNDISNFNRVVASEARPDEEGFKKLAGYRTKVKKIEPSGDSALVTVEFYTREPEGSSPAAEKQWTVGHLPIPNTAVSSKSWIITEMPLP